MVSLTTQQRDLIRKILKSDTAVITADIAQDLGLTSRQIGYRLKPVRTWLAQRDAVLKTTPGLGIEILCSSDQRSDLLYELEGQTNFQLILTPAQRQQFFTLCLLTADDPLILNWLQHSAAVSKPTVLNDLDLIEAWVGRHNLSLVRRPNYGLSLAGSELALRQAFVALLWGDTSFGEPLTKMTFHSGLLFSLANASSDLPLIQYTNKLFENLDTQTTLDGVTYAETQLGGRFTDDAVLHLALAFSIQKYRIQTGHYIESDPETLQWVETKKVWPVAVEIFQTMGADSEWNILPPEVSYIAVHLLAGTRNHLWPGDLYVDPSLTDLIALLMKEVAQAFRVDELSHDASLRDGLFAHIIPAIMRQRFEVWTPSVWSDGTLSLEYSHEYNIARELSTIVTEQTGVILPEGEIDTLTLLLKAAFIRERPQRSVRVFIICPSGMATAQLLVARLKPQFPTLEIVGILSLRELTPERVAGAHFLISTVPVETPIPSMPVIQLHPLLLPEDVETITNYLTSIHK